MLAAVLGVERFHTYIYGQSFMIKSDHKLLESISRKNLADTPAWLQCMMLCLQGYDFTIHYCPGKGMVIPDTLSQFSPCPGPTLPLDITIHCPHNARLQRSLPTSLHQWSRNESSCWPHHYWLAQGHQGGPLSPPSILATPRNPHHRGWSSPTRWSTHHSSCQKGENPTSTTSIPSGNNKVTVAHAWKFLLARHEQGHWRSSLPVWSLYPVPEPECCSTPHTYTIVPMADVCHRHLHTRRNWPPVSGQLLLDAFHLARAIPTRSSHCWRRCFQNIASPKSFTLTMAHNTQVPSLPTSVYLWAYHMKPQVSITHNPMDLLMHASSLSNMHSDEPNTAVPIHILPY